MIKRKRKINKKELINVRLYTVTGNNGRPKHHFIRGEVVRKYKSISDDRNYYQSVTTGLKQYVSSTDII
ncbi:hypothetical protein HOS95_gp07 [Salmonella phage vB_SpuP_Spp16]|uniref:Uncharacterized protein n=1 Tax=Salmonella phage vB_SpuP_Spp16 TaxID=2081603 RepID=A0A2P9JZT6_9CAUD|nr:hypothetical protein HOS95_gp07 [Salmonella phage vB_SpuP_Spp16]AVI05052.1 hypothetical protein [Salmonella phage vB_SpuP_Spp16]